MEHFKNEAQMRFSCVLIVTAVSLLSFHLAPAQEAPSDAGYKIIAKSKVGGAGGFDYVFADSNGRKLYVPRSAGRGAGANVKSRVDVYDLDTLAPVGSI